MWQDTRKTQATWSGSETEGGVQCSFCGKTQDQVRKLVAGPKVYICDECIDLCNDIIAEEPEQDVQRQEGQPVAEREVSLAGTPLCIVCRMPKDIAEVVFVPERGLVCTVCVEVIRAVTDEKEEMEEGNT